MKKITCTNSLCEAIFSFDEQRYPNAKEVKCPKCKNIQSLKKDVSQKSSSAADFNWHKQDLTPQKAPEEDFSAPPVQPILSLIVGDWVYQRTFSLKSGRNFIGRRADNDIVLDQDEHISRRHAVLEVVAMPNGNWRYLLYDIGNLGETQSKNGVYVSGKRLNTVEYFNLTTGSSFQLGDTKLKLT